MRPWFLMVMLVVLSLGAACGGQDNIADCEEGRKEIPCSARTADENARLALDDKDYAKAIAILTDLTKEEPEVYKRYTLLAAAYAGRAGFAILNITRAKFVEGGTLLDQMQKFLPSKADLGPSGYQKSVADMELAVSTLKAIPTTLLADTSTADYAPSASLQRTLYQAAYSMMYMNQFAISAETGEFDPEQLESMTEADAIIILENLSEAAATEGGDRGELLQKKIDEALADIATQDGEDKREKLIEFLKKEQTGELEG